MATVSFACVAPIYLHAMRSSHLSSFLIPTCKTEQVDLEPGCGSSKDRFFGKCFVCMQCSHFLYAMRSSHLSCKTKQVDVEPGCGSSKDRFFGRCFVCMQCYHLSIKHVKLKYLLCCNESCLVV